jgi:hypothetical protein
LMSVLFCFRIAPDSLRIGSVPNELCHWDRGSPRI